LDSIEQYQKDDLLAQSFLKLKKYREKRASKNLLATYANQQYIFNLGKRVILNLKINSMVKVDKKILYENVGND
jgi:hypothetical protein